MQMHRWTARFMTETLARCSDLNYVRTCCRLIFICQVSHIPKFAYSIFFLFLVCEGWLKSKVSNEDLLAWIRGV